MVRIKPNTFLTIKVLALAFVTLKTQSVKQMTNRDGETSKDQLKDLINGDICDNDYVDGKYDDHGRKHDYHRDDNDHDDRYRGDHRRHRRHGDHHSSYLIARPDRN
ncbi:hypothetical protein ACTXT7_007864 [Hymenolepis weldensis]